MLALYAIGSLYKKIMDIPEKRIGDSTEREKTVTIALNTVTQNIDSSNKTLESVNSAMKAILITLEKNNGKS